MKFRESRRILNQVRRRLVTPAVGVFEPRILGSMVTMFSSVGLLAAPSGEIICKGGAGNVELRRESEWRAASQGDPIELYEAVKTYPKSYAMIGLLGDAIAQVNVETTVELRPGGNRIQEGVVLHVNRGEIYLNTVDRPIRVAHEDVVVRADDTQFSVSVEQDEATTLTVFEGGATLSNSVGKREVGPFEKCRAEIGEMPGEPEAIKVQELIQWWLHLPAVLYPKEVGFNAREKERLKSSLERYRAGDLPGALKRLPAKFEPESKGERVYYAGLLLALGQPEKGRAILKEANPESSFVSALQRMVEVVKGQSEGLKERPSTATEWMVESYHQQSRAVRTNRVSRVDWEFEFYGKNSSPLENARKAAKRAVDRAPSFGFAQARLAEVEFSFGRIREATKVLERCFKLSPNNPKAWTLDGFFHLAKGHIREGRRSFERAMAIDGAFADAWLGRGLSRIRLGDEKGGRADLLTAATLEPTRSVLRSYLGKAYYNEALAKLVPEGPKVHPNKRLNQLAEKELKMAKDLDPNDPTPYLYAALMYQQGNRINEAVRNLEKSVRRNDNRAVYRSSELLDEDRAVRSANLASIYKDAGMPHVSVREAIRSVNYDYDNYSGHLFLAESYNALRDPQLVNLRFETATFNELLLANLLQPADAGALSQTISRQEYSRLFQENDLGGFSETRYRSNGDWVQQASQFGTFEKASYSFDASYRDLNGFRANEELDEERYTAKLKQELGLSDSVFVRASHSEAEFGDLRQRFDPNTASPTLRRSETLEPVLLTGYHHEWSNRSHFLAIGSLVSGRSELDEPSGTSSLFLTGPQRNRRLPVHTDINYSSDVEVYGAELQQIIEWDVGNSIVGGRLQSGRFDGDNAVSLRSNPPLIKIKKKRLTRTNHVSDLRRYTVYGYQNFQVLDPLLVTVGLSYDGIRYPVNHQAPPIKGREERKSRLSPKAGFIWSPWPGTQIRGAYSRSLGGVSFDQSIRIEPSQVAGFTQAFRSISPQSKTMSPPAAEFEMSGVGIEQKLPQQSYLGVPTKTYLGAVGRVLTEEGRTVQGGYSTRLRLGPGGVPTAGEVQQVEMSRSQEFRESSLNLYMNQLLGDHFTASMEYKVSHANLDISAKNPPFSARLSDAEALLHRVRLAGLVNLSNGLFLQADSVWHAQDNMDRGLPEENFWQVNALIGYRFLRRRAEVRVGLENIFDRDYRLNPLNRHSRLPRERTLMVSGKFEF